MNERYTSQLYRRLSVIAVLTLLGFTLILCPIFLSLAQDFSESEKYVHNFVNVPPYGNWTLVEKPVFPVYLDRDQITVGSNWTIVCPLIADHTYHIYCYGEWVDYGSEPATDYDVYVYNPFGELEGYHTESAGFPEHLGSTVNEAFFVPRWSGNYSFVISNDPRESTASQPATFMIVENSECNMWREVFIQGKESNMSVLNTSWAFEFVSENQEIQVVIKVPEDLDMYEVRLYLMANPQLDVGSTLNDVPLAWESGLYGERLDMFGGYRLESKDYRGIEYASCEFYGQDMFINFTSPYLGKSLYHLVFIGEEGSGIVDFLIKTEFENMCLKPLVVPQKAFPYNDTVVAYLSNSTDLTNATIRYSINEWKNTSVLKMNIVDNRTCQAIIPGQAAATLVSYMVEADDIFENVLVAYGNYSVKHPSVLNLSLISESVNLGENITVRGYLAPPDGRLPVIVQFTSANETRQILCYTLENGTFTASFRPESSEIWKIQAMFSEDKFRYRSMSSELKVRVEEPPFLAKYGLYIGGGMILMVITGAVVYWKKSRG